MITTVNINHLKDCQQRFIIRRLAEYEHPEIIAIEFEDLYDQTITLEDIKALNPILQDSSAKAFLSYFIEIRKTLFDKALAHSTFKFMRIEKLKRLLFIAEKEQNNKLILEIHEQIRRESDPVLADLVKLLKLSDKNISLKEYMA